MKIYVQFLEYRRCILVNLFLFFPVVSGKCAEKIQVINEAVNDDNGMLIFTQIDTLHKTICVILISEKVLIVYYDLSFPFLTLKRFGWERVTELKNVVLCSAVGSRFYICELKLAVYLFITSSSPPRILMTESGEYKLGFGGHLGFELKRYTHLEKHYDLK